MRDELVRDVADRLDVPGVTCTARSRRGAAPARRGGAEAALARRVRRPARSLAAEREFLVALSGER